MKFAGGLILVAILCFFAAWYWPTSSHQTEATTEPRDLLAYRYVKEHHCRVFSRENSKMIFDYQTGKFVLGRGRTFYDCGVNPFAAKFIIIDDKEQP